MGALCRKPAFLNTHGTRPRNAALFRVRETQTQRIEAYISVSKCLLGVQRFLNRRGSFQAICADFLSINLSLKKSSISIVKSSKTEKDTLDVIPPWNFSTRVNFQFCAHVRQHQASTSHMAICVYHLNLSNYVINNELFSLGHAGLSSFCKVLFVVLSRAFGENQCMFQMSKIIQ